MITMFKYPIVPGLNLVPMPTGAVVQSCGLDGQGQMSVWAGVDPRIASTARSIYVAGTGRDLPDDSWRFIGTVTDAPFVWHVFAEKTD